MKITYRYYFSLSLSLSLPLSLSLAVNYVFFSLIPFFLQLYPGLKITYTIFFNSRCKWLLTNIPGFKNNLSFSNLSLIFYFCFCKITSSSFLHRCFFFFFQNSYLSNNILENNIRLGTLRSSLPSMSLTISMWLLATALWKGGTPSSSADQYKSM